MARPPKVEAVAGRVQGIDFLKGALILLVIAGHIMTYDQYLIKHLIYGFHMPLFLAVSGFMLRQDALRQTGFTALCRRYANRMLLPWLLAFIAYFLMEQRTDLLAGRLEGKVLLHNILYPAFHLWYVPILFLMICGLWLYERQGWSIPLLCGLAALFSIAWIWGQADPIRGPEALYYLGDKRLTAFFSFFLLGYGLRHRLVPVPAPWVGVGVLGLMLGLHGAAYYLAWGHWERLITVGLHFSAIAVLLPFFTCAQDLRLAPINWIGQQSLGIYLWHPFFIFAAHKFIYSPESPLPFYLLSAALIGLLLLPGVRLAMAIGPLNRIVLGNGPAAPRHG